jgi:hypothetical protein
VFATPKADSKQYIGLGDASDRLFFGYDGLTFGVGRRRGGVDTFVPAIEFSGSNDVDWNRQLGNIYQLRFQWLGYGYLRFAMLDFETEDGGYRRLHTIKYPNTSPDVHILNPTLPIFAEIQNAGNNTDVAMYTPSAGAFVEGDIGEVVNPLDVFNAEDTAVTIADTNNNHVLTVSNKSTFAGLTNRIPVQIDRITLSRGTGAALSRLRLYRNATFAGALTYADKDANNSPVAVSTTTTTITSVNAEKSYGLPASSAPLVIEFNPGELVLQPGETISLGDQNSGVQSTDIVATLDWREQF